MSSILGFGVLSFERGGLLTGFGYLPIDSKKQSSALEAKAAIPDDMLHEAELSGCGRLRVLRAGFNGVLIAI